MDLRPVSEIPDATVELTNPQGKTEILRQHDADTLYSDSGVGKRLVEFDAAETPKLTKAGGFSAGSQLGVAQTRAIGDLFNQGVFKNIEVTGKDYFDRDLAKVTTPQGQSVGSYAIQHNIVQPNKYTSDEDMVRRSFQMFKDNAFEQPDKTPAQKAREIVDDVLRGGQTIVRPQANTIEEYQDYTSATSNKGLGKQEQDILNLEKRIKSEKINDAQRIQYQKQLDTLRDNYMANLNAPKDLYTGSLEGMNKRSGYGTMGELGRAWDMGLISVKDSAANFLEYTGDVFNSKDTIQAGKDWQRDNNRARRLVDVSAGDRDITGGTVTNLADVEKDFSKVFKFVGTSVLQYGPQMAVMIGGSLAGGLAAGPAGATVVPMAMGIADVYGEMPDDEKSVAMATAIGSAVGLVDRLGFAKGAIKGADLLTKEGIAATAGKIAALKNITVPEATVLLHKEVMDMGKEYAVFVKNVATDQLKAKQNFVDLIADITKHGGQEAATEAVQEVMQYAGIRGTTSLDFDWNELYQRTKESAIIGGILGSTMSVPTASYDRSKFNEQLNILQGIETRPLSSNTLMEQEEIARHGYKIDDINLANKLRGYISKNNPTPNLQSLIKTGDSSSLAADISSIITEGGLLDTTRDNNLGKYVQYQGGREIAGLFDANSVRGVYAGMSGFKRIQAMANNVMSMLPTNSEKRQLFQTENNKDIGALLLDSLNNKNQHKGAATYRSYLNEIGAFLGKQLDDLGPNHGWNITEITQPDFFLKNQVVDPNLVRANTADFVDTILKNYQPQGINKGKLNRASIEDLAKRISDGMSHQEMSELKDLGLLDNPALNKFRSMDVEHNITKMIEMISRSSVRNTIFGPHGEVIANGIQKMVDAKEITPEEASKLAVATQQMLTAFDGKLNEIKNPLWRGAQENLNFATTLVYMDTSLFANLAEVVTGALGLSPANVVKYFGLFAKEGAKDIAAKLTQVGSLVSGGRLPSYEERELSGNARLLQATGHEGKANDIAFNVGANINSQAKRNMSKVMFKVNLIESATNAARAARAAIASDEINHLVSIVAEMPNNNDTTRWARDRLSYYRMDPDKLVQLYNQLGQISVERLQSLDPSSQLYADLKAQIQPGIINFIDEFSSRPEPGSTAKIFDDHRFALFTQFKKFTWHLTSNMIPHLWNMYLKRGKPEYTYSSFSLLITSFMVAYMGMYLKSMLRGDEEENDEKKLGKRLKQAFDYSFGAAPADLYNSISEATAERKDGTLKNSPFKSVIAQSPSLNLFANTGKDIYGIATKPESDREKTSLIRRVPVFGEIPAVRDIFKKE